MKRFLALFLTIIMLLAIVSCTPNVEPVETTAESTTPEVTTPEVTTPEVTTPEVTTPEVTTPEVTTPEVTTPEVTTPEVTTPEVTTPEVTTPEVTTPEVTTPEVTTPEVTTPEVTTPEVTTPEVTTPDGGDDPVVPPVDKTAADIVASLNPNQSFEATFDCQEAIFEDVASFNTILDAFKTAGYTQLEVSMVEGAKFETILLTKADELVTLYWIEAENEARVVWEKADAEALSVLSANASTGTETLTMVQIGVARGEAVDNPMIGMCYILKLSNGRAIVIDGGYYYDDCAINLYNTLAKLDIAKTEDNKFIIEAWIFTHGHGDHNGVLNNFVPLYGDKTEINYFLYQLPVNEEISAVGGGLAGEAAFHELCKTAYPNATYINPHVGLNYYFGNATVSMLYTPDVLWATDNKITYYNNTSLLFNVHGGGTGFLCFGDAGELAAKRSWELFDEIAYKSGIFQITHHGLTTDDGANEHVWEYIGKIYKATGATTVVLPMGTRRGNDLDSGNGRWAVIFDYPHNKDGNVSYIIDRSSVPTANGYFATGLFCRFVETVETGRNVIAESDKYKDYAHITSLHGYNGINIIDNGHGITTYIASADKVDMVTNFLFANGSVTVKENEKLQEWLVLPEHDAADVIEKIDSDAQVFESTFGTQEVVLKNVADKATVIDQLTAHGFEAIAMTPVAGAKFETLLFTNGAELVTVYWKPAESEARILFEKLDKNILSVLAPNASTGTGELTMVQVGIQRGPTDTGSPLIGMCYVIKLSDGRAIVIDGGFNLESNADNVYNALSKLDIARNEKGQYIIAAWFFSHGDGDHIGVMEAFGNKYNEKADVEYIIYNLPSVDQLLAPTSAAGEKNFVDNFKAAYPNAVHLIARTGVQYYFGNATIDMLYTPDFVWSPESKITYYNSTSLVFMVNGGGVSFLSTGDAGESAFTVMWNNYESSTFACDVFQYPHHGLTTQENTGAKYSEYTWTYIKKVLDATGAKYAVLPMGDRQSNNTYNGRAVEMIFRGNAGKGISYMLNMNDKTGGLSNEVYEAFVKAVAEGTNTHDTYLGYNGINMLKSANGLITYMSGSELDPMATVFSFANGELTVTSNQKLYDWLAEPNFIDSFESTFDSNMEVWSNVHDVAYFVDPLLAQGYTRLAVDMIEGAKFETIMLSKGTDLVVMYWYKETGEMRIAYDTIEEGATAPLTPNEQTGKGEIIVAQIGVDIVNPDDLYSSDGNPMIGLCYIFKLSDGRAMIIDGGFAYDSNADNLFFALESLEIAKDENGKFIIEAWFFTHGHGDHNGITTTFFKKYAHLTTINYFIYQMPSNSDITPTGAGVAGEAAFHELCKTAHPEAKYINPHAGVTYYFGNASVDMLYTPDMIWSNSFYIPDYNDTSLIFKTYGGGCEGLLTFGDAGEIPAATVVKHYDISAVNSDVLQILHHGLTTGANEGYDWKNVKILYEGATVEYAFLPMGVPNPNISRNGRWSVLCVWGYTGRQVSFVINHLDDGKGVSLDNYKSFIKGVQDGTLDGETFLGYNGYNIIDNGRGVTTYIHSTETAPMVTIMSFNEGEVSVELNMELHLWLELTH